VEFDRVVPPGAMVFAGRWSFEIGEHPPSGVGIGRWENMAGSEFKYDLVGWLVPRGTNAN
jgi:hypothetical protein